MHQPRALHLDEQVAGDAHQPRIGRRVERAADVGELPLEQCCAPRVVGARSDAQAPLEVGGAHALAFAGPFELLAGEVTHRVEHAEPALAVDVGERDHRGVDQARQRRRNRAAIEVFVGTHRFGDVQRPTSGEDRESAKQNTVIVVEQVVAPLQRSTQRLVMWDGRRAAEREQMEAVADAVGDLVDGQRARQPRRQFDRER